MTEDIIVQAEALRMEQERSAILERDLEASNKEIEAMRAEIESLKKELDASHKYRQDLCKAADEQVRELKEVLRSISLLVNLAERK